MFHRIKNLTKRSYIMAKITRYQGGRDLLSQLHEDFNRLLAPFDLRSELRWPEIPSSEWIPSIDVQEEDNQFIIHADVPGVKASDIDISMENGMLTIKGKRQSESKEKKENYLRIERASGSFLRQIALPETIDQEKIEATFRDGVLKIILPKTTKPAGKKINIKSE